MSLHPQPISPVPVETARVARAAFPKGNALMLMRDELGAIYEDEAFAHLFPRRGQPAEAPWRLALVTIFQFAESLSDRRAADAVRARIDWKYALSLELDDPGFDASVLCEFRARLLEGGGGQPLLDTLLARFREMGLLKVGKQRTDSTHVLAAVRALDRYELVGETMRHALDVLATVAPDWLRERAEPEWGKRYARRTEDDRLPSKKEKRRALAETIGGDGYALLEAIYAGNAPGWLREVPAVQTLRRIWVQQYACTEQGFRFRTDEDGLPPAVRFIASPYEPDAHYARKYSTSWIGYKAHLTKTCEDEAPNQGRECGDHFWPCRGWGRDAHSPPGSQSQGLAPRGPPGGHRLSGRRVAGDHEAGVRRRPAGADPAGLPLAGEGGRGLRRRELRRRLGAQAGDVP
jgi:transposase